jgi:hypothetical protein
MQVQDTNGLVVDSNVLLRGVPVGKITKIQSSVDGATIAFYVEKKFPIPVDSEVRLENLSALGETYIGLVPRTAAGPMLRDGQRVATENITAPVSISELATSVVHFLDQTDPGSLSRMVAGADAALPNPDVVLPNLTRTARLLRDTVTTMGGRGSETLANFQTLLQNAGWVGPTIAAMTPGLYDIDNDMYPFIDQAADFLGKLGAPETLRLIYKLLQTFQKFLDQRGPDLKVIGQSLMPYMQGIAASLMNVDTGQILTNILRGFPEDGVVTLHLTVPNH